jgi:ABC-type branched-subunit amino acid transport system ATPase component
MLEVEDVSKRFGGVAALDGCSFSVAEGTVMGLIGPNGSGKTTLFDLLTGFARPDRGRLVYRSRLINGLRPDRISRLGIGRTFQLTRIFPRLSVLQNLQVAVPRSGHEGPGAERAYELLDLLALARLAHQPAGRLSFGQQKLLELGSVMMARPRLVLLDEPAGGVNPVLLETIEARIRHLNEEEGTTFLIVEHNMGFVMELCDPVVVLAHGRRIAQGSPAEVSADPVVLDAYLGS